MTVPDNDYDNLDDLIDDPAPLDSPKWEALENRLILITPADEKELPTQDGMGKRMVIHGRVVVLDGPGAPEVWSYTPVFPMYLQGQCRPNLGTGRSNLGRLGKDASRKKAGQTAPWVLAKPSSADRQAASAFLRAARSGSAPSGPPAPSTPQSPARPAPALDEPPF